MILSLTIAAMPLSSTGSAALNATKGIQAKRIATRRSRFTGPLYALIPLGRKGTQSGFAGTIQLDRSHLLDLLA